MPTKFLPLLFASVVLVTGVESWLFLRFALDSTASAAAPAEREVDPEFLARLEALALRIERLDEAAVQRDASIEELARGGRASERELATRRVQAPAESTPSPSPVSPASPNAEAELASLLPRVLGAGRDEASLEEQERFWRLAREGTWVDERLAELRARVDSDPQDMDARLELAQTYVAKLLTVPAGPERGVWGTRAEEQWQAVVDVDPRNWDATFSLGENWSYYPAFLGKADVALETLERARELQEASAQQPRQAETYALLARLHGQQGDSDAARAALEAGLAHHPDDVQLGQALAGLEE